MQVKAAWWLSGDSAEKKDLWKITQFERLSGFPMGTDEIQVIVSSASFSAAAQLDGKDLINNGEAM